MYASVQKHDVQLSSLFRFCGRTGGVIILAVWMLAVGIEFVRWGAPVVSNYYQAVFLVVIFIGYAAGWRWEDSPGGGLAIVGTVGFLILNLVLLKMAPMSGAEWFAVPGVFYLIAHYLDNLRDKQMSSQP